MLPGADAEKAVAHDVQDLRVIACRAREQQMDLLADRVHVRADVCVEVARLLLCYRTVPVTDYPLCVVLVELEHHRLQVRGIERVPAACTVVLGWGVAID